MCISSGSLNLISFILDHVICIFVANFPPCLYALVGEFFKIYLFISIILAKIPSSVYIPLSTNATW